MTRSAPRSQAPADLSAEQWNALARWASEREPWAAQQLGELVEQCLDHHRARGNAMADWTAACRTWVRNERRFRGGRGDGGGAPRKAPGGSNGGGGRGDVATAARRFARRLGLFEGNDG